MQHFVGQLLPIETKTYSNGITSESDTKTRGKTSCRDITLVSDLVTAALLQSSAMLVAKIKQKLSWSAVTDHAIRETDDDTKRTFQQHHPVSNFGIF